MATSPKNYESGADGAENPLVAKLGTVTNLAPRDRLALIDACRDVREVGRCRDIMKDGEKPEHVHVMIEGWAARYKILPDGARQITAFLVPGDFCDLNMTILDEMDHSIEAITHAKVAYVPHEEVKALSRRPKLVRALWWATLVDEAVLRAWIVNVGRRSAYQAIAHLFCELHIRLSNVGLAAARQFDLPVTQEAIADALGLTPVHVNRMLQRLRSNGLIQLRQGTLTILDVSRLRQASGFNPSYLHVKQRV